MNKFNALIASHLVAALLLIGVSVASQAAPPPPGGAPTATSSSPAAQCDKSNLPIPTWYEYVPLDAECKIPSNQDGTIVILIIMGIFDMVLFLAGFIAVIIVIVGGYKLLTSNGEPQKIAGARTTIINALVGLAIAFIASQIVGFIAGRLG